VVEMVEMPVDLFVLLPNAARTVVATNADRARTRPFAMCTGLVSPPNNLRKEPNTVDFSARDSPRNNDLVPFRSLLICNQRKGLDRRHALVRLVVVSYPNGLVIRNAKVDTRNRPLPASFQLSEPLM